MPEFVNPFVGMVPGRKMTQGELLRALRLSLAAEEEATHIYQAIAEATSNELARAVLLDIANEERVHKGEFQRLIELLAPQEVDFMAQGASEVQEIKEKLGSQNIKIDEPQNEIVTVGNLKSNK
ncbi:MAG TPA: ferritin family protein [Chitinispirillaceae bacterium]|nr:ferritin family protein [Chitinispirillaceae bacterium]